MHKNNNNGKTKTLSARIKAKKYSVLSLHKKIQGCTCKVAWKALSKTRLRRAVDAPSAHSGRSCRSDNPFPQLPPRRCAGKSTVLRGEPAMESKGATLNSLDFPTESNLFRQRATLGCAHLMPQHLQHACTPPFKCLSLTGQRLNLNSPPPKADVPDAQAGPAGLGAGLRRSGRGCSKISR